MASDWSSFDSYVELDRAVGEAGSMPAPDFVGGPLRKFFELALDEDKGPGTQARTLEFARHRFDEQRRALADRPGELARLESEVQAQVLSRFGPGTAGHWLLDVWEGRAGHHGVRRP